MASPQREPGPRIDALEGRADRVEDYLRHVLSHEVAAVRGAVGLVHSDVQDLRSEVTRNGQLLDQVAAEVSTVARSQIEHGAAVATLAGKVDRLEGKVDAQGETLKSHGQVLGRLESAVTEILRRLPAVGD